MCMCGHAHVCRVPGCVIQIAPMWIEQAGEVRSEAGERAELTAAERVDWTGEVCGRQLQVGPLGIAATTLTGTEPLSADILTFVAA